MLLTPPLPYSEAAARCREGGGGAEIWGGDGDNNVTLAEIAESLGTTTGAFWILNTGSSVSPKPSLCLLELETKAIGRFAKVTIVSYSRPSLMIIASASQFHVYLPWGQRPFSIVS